MLPPSVICEVVENAVPSANFPASVPLPLIGTTSVAYPCPRGVFVAAPLAGKAIVYRDFSPEAVARKVAGVKELLEAREQLANLLSYMDGKSGAEQLINKLLDDPALLKTLSAQAKAAGAAASTADEPGK